MASITGLIVKPLARTALTATATTAQEEQGILRYEVDPTTGLKVYRYVKNAGAAAIANGSVCYAADRYCLTVGTAVAEGVTATVNSVCGVGIGAIAAASYGWIQVYGDHSVVRTSGADDIVKGDAIIGSGTGTCIRVAAGTAPTNKIAGFATADDVDANNTVQAFLECI